MLEQNITGSIRSWTVTSQSTGKSQLLGHIPIMVHVHIPIMQLHVIKGVKRRKKTAYHNILEWFCFISIKWTALIIYKTNDIKSLKKKVLEQVTALCHRLAG